MTEIGVADVIEVDVKVVDVVVAMSLGTGGLRAPLEVETSF
jgi:hypothetical protein